MPDLQTELAERGERRHEQCRFGIFAQESYIVDMAGAKTPTAIPLCGWELPEPVPPSLKRGWGGWVDFDRDCALCDAYSPLLPDPPKGADKP